MGELWHGMGDGKILIGKRKGHEWIA